MRLLIHVFAFYLVWRDIERGFWVDDGFWNLCTDFFVWDNDNYLEFVRPSGE